METSHLEIREYLAQFNFYNSLTVPQRKILVRAVFKLLSDRTEEMKKELDLIDSTRDGEN